MLYYSNFSIGNLIKTTIYLMVIAFMIMTLMNVWIVVFRLFYCKFLEYIDKYLGEIADREDST